jgi:hypothetical protein
MKSPYRPHELEAGKRLGQQIVELATATMAEAGTNNMKLVLNVMAGVVSHYIGGLPPEVRQEVYDHFGKMLADHLGHIDEAHSAQVHLGEPYHAGSA